MMPLSMPTIRTCNNDHHGLQISVNRNISDLLRDTEPLTGKHCQTLFLVLKVRFTAIIINQGLSLT